MQKLKSAYILMLLSLYVGTVTAQNNDKVGQLYEDMAYKEVIKLYESKDDLKVEDMERIANGYRLNHDTENAAFWYRQVVARNNTPINYLYFAQALQSNGDFEEAKKYFLHYNELVGNQGGDQRGNYLAEAIDRMNDWKNEEAVILKQETYINSEKLDFSPSFYENGIVFVSSRKLKDNKKYKWTGDHFMNLFYAPANRDGDLQEVQSFSKMINSQYHEGPVTFSKSFDRIFFTRNDHLKGKLKTSKDGVMKLGIFTALRDGDKWTAPKALNFNTKEYEECHPSLSADGKRLYFASDREGGVGGMDIYYSEFMDGKWSEPINLGLDVNTPGNEVFPFIHDDGTLYFASDGWGGMGGMDIFYSNKSNINQWSRATNMGQPYNSRKDDFGFILNVLGTEGYLTSSRSGGKGKDDIYSFKRGASNMEKPATALPSSDPAAGNSNPQFIFYHIENKGQESPALDEKKVAELLAAHADKKDNERPIIIVVDGKERLKLSFDNDSAYVVHVENETPAEVEENAGELVRKINTFDHLLTKEEVAIGDIYELKDVYYNFDKYDITKKATKELDRVVHYMKENPTIEIELSAHTDSRGRSRYNQWLSRKRAEAAVQYITDNGIDPDRLVARGYGESNLKNSCSDGKDCDEENHKVNRRTEIKIVKK